MSVFLSWVLGGITTILVALWVEHMRRPRLRLTLPDPHDRQYVGRHARQARYLCVAVSNAAPIRLTGQRNAAQQCRARITFHRIDGTNIFGRALTARWDSSPEPVPIQGLIEGGQKIQILDPGRFEAVPQMDIVPGQEPISFAVTARFDDEPECYGWSNESYFSNPPWRHPDWRLGAGSYLVEVTVLGGGEKVSKVYRLHNDCPQSSFRLEQASEAERMAVTGAARRMDRS